MIYTEFDIKLLRHALDTNSEGEAANAAAMFFKELRKRGVKAHEFLETKGEASAASSPPSRESNIDYKARYEELKEENWRIKLHLHDLGTIYKPDRDMLCQLRRELDQCQEELVRARKKSWFK